MSNHANMSIIIKPYCRKFSVSTAFLLFFHISFSQNSFSKVDEWLKNNLEEEGGCVVLLVYKDGKIVYSKSENGDMVLVNGLWKSRVSVLME